MKMADQLVASFSLDLNLSSGQNDTAAPHPRLADFKSRPVNTSDQESRRQQMIKRQKLKRVDAVNYARKLVDGDLTESDLYSDENSEETCKEKRFNPFKNQLMLSEWLVEVPEDIAEEWIMRICPVGKRCLVVANRGSTSAYTKSGYCVNRFPSMLPGGCKTTGKPGEYTILDCIYSEVQRKFYVIDITCWRGHPVYDSETEFRCYWLRTKLADEERLKTKSRLNPYEFFEAPCVGCSSSEIQQALPGSYSFEVDGVLFYHKRTHYTPGRTPLVGWLKPYMIPEILGIPLPQQVTDKTPPVNKLNMLNANVKLQDSDKDRGSMEIVNGCSAEVDMS